MSLERALAGVPYWRVGEIIEVRGRGRYKVVEITLLGDTAMIGKVVEAGGVITYYAADATVTLRRLGSPRTGGRQSRLSAEIFNQREDVAETKIKKSSADGAPPDGIVAI